MVVTCLAEVLLPMRMRYMLLSSLIVIVSFLLLLLLLVLLPGAFEDELLGARCHQLSSDID